MSKVTSKLQVTVPKAVAERFGIRPGSEIQWIPTGETLRIETERRKSEPISTEERLRLFDAATDRQRQRNRRFRRAKPGEDRGWTREELYVRARPR